MLQQAKNLGIADSYWDIVGNLHQTSEDTLHYFIDVLSHTEKQSTDFDDVFLLSANQPNTLLLPLKFSAYVLCDEQQKVVAQESNGHWLTKWQAPALSAGYYTLTTNIAQGKQHYRLIVALNRPGFVGDHLT